MLLVPSGLLLLILTLLKGDVEQPGFMQLLKMDKNNLSVLVACTLP